MINRPPYLTIGPEDLSDETVQIGDELPCEECGQLHALKAPRNNYSSKYNTEVLFYVCSDGPHLAAVDNHLLLRHT